MKKLLTLLTLVVLFFLLYLGISSFYQQTRVSIEYQVGVPETAQLYWKGKKFLNNPESYSEQQSIKKRLSPHRKKIEFFIPTLHNINTIRFDPAKRKTTITIRSIFIKGAGYNSIKLTQKEQWQKNVTFHDIKIINAKDGNLALSTIGKDPQLELKLNTSLNPFLLLSDSFHANYQNLKSRMELLGISIGALFFLILDILIILSFSATLQRMLFKELQSTAEQCIGLCLISLSLIILSTIATGMVYLLSWKSLMLFHCFAWIIVQFFRSQWRVNSIWPDAVEDLRSGFQSLWGGIKRIIIPKERTPVSFLNSLLLISILFLLIYYIIPAAFTLPLNFDSNDYRLSRVGYWLQEGHVWQFATNDIRQAIMPVNCDFAMIWITSFFKKGYPLVHLISFLGGVLVCSSLYSLCKLLLLPMQWRLMAVIIWLGIPNSACQMLTSQTDLFTTGCLMAGLIFLLKAVQNDKHAFWVLAGAGIGLSVGAKSTVLLWGPGLLFVFIAMVICYRSRLTFKRFALSVVICAVAMVILSGFNYSQNFYYWGNPLGPKIIVKGIQDQTKPVIIESGKKKEYSKNQYIQLRAKTYLWQIFEPSSNLDPIRPVTNYFFDSIEGHIKETVDHLKSHFSGKFNTASNWFRTSRMSEDYLSFGFVPFLLLFIGGLVACYRAIVYRNQLDITIAILFVSVLMYMIFFCIIAGWTAHRYRYAVLVTPFIAVISMYFLYSMTLLPNSKSHLLSYGVIFFIVLLQFSMSVKIASVSKNHGWKPVLNLSKTQSYVFYYRDVRKLIERLPEDVKNLGIFLNRGSWKSLFFRTGRDLRSVVIASDKSIVVDDTFLDDHRIDGIVTKKFSSIFIEGHYNLVQSGLRNYQALVRVKGDKSVNPWIVLRGIWSNGWTKTYGHMTIGNWKEPSIPIEVCHPAIIKQDISLQSSLMISKVSFGADENGCKMVPVKIKSNDTITWNIDPGYVSKKQRSLGIVKPLGVKLRLPDLKSVAGK